MTSRSSSCVVLVTGAAGFLGQHVVGLLQQHASHVTEIRVLDVIPYVNKLDYPERVQVKGYVGSVTDETKVSDACKGANCVMHLASSLDNSLFPDKAKLHSVNVGGTQTIISACKKQGVERLIYCSSVSVVIGNENIYNGTEDNTHYSSDSFLFEEYGQTKMQAERMVLQANCDTLHTVSLRPAAIYGDLGLGPWDLSVDSFLARKTGKYIHISCGKGKLDYTYVGNVAWGFICAEKTLHTNDEKSKRAAGQCFFVTDESPKKGLFEFAGLFLADFGLKPLPVGIPLVFILYIMYFVRFILSILTLFCKVNIPLGISTVLCLSMVHLFKYD